MFNNQHIYIQNLRSAADSQSPYDPGPQNQS